MKKYKALVTGKNDLTIDDLFVQTMDVFDLMTCSHRLMDREKHIDLFKPDLFIICLNDDRPDEMNGYTELKRKLAVNGITTVVIGRPEDCEAFRKRAVQVADLFLTRPITAEKIRTGILDYLEQIEKEKEEQAELYRHLEEMRKSKEKKHVLIVDDDPLMLKVVKEYLGEKYNVGTAISGKIALKFLESRQTNLILLDYEMPEENGPEVLRKIRLNSDLANIPVVFLTGVTDQAKLVEALSLKPQGYLLKPVDQDKLLGTLEKIIG